MPTVVASLALLVAIAALVVAMLPQWTARRRSHGADELPDDVLGLRQEVAALRAEAAGSLRHLAVVRYDAFGDMGGQMSWSLALLDDHLRHCVVSAAQDGGDELDVKLEEASDAIRRVAK